MKVNRKAMFQKSLATRVTLGLGVAALGLTAMMSPASAVNSVTQSVTAGTRTASLADLTLGAVTTSHAAQNSAGTLALTADDSSGSGAGWNVTVLTSAFVYTGSNGGTAIPAANFSLTSAATPVATAGQAVDVTAGPKVPATTPIGTLETARKVVQADASFGQGTYTQALGVTLSVPANSRVGTYTGTMTTTIAAAP